MFFIAERIILFMLWLHANNPNIQWVQSANSQGADLLLYENKVCTLQVCTKLQKKKLWLFECFAPQGDFQCLYTHPVCFSQNTSSCFCHVASNCQSACKGACCDMYRLEENRLFFSSSHNNKNIITETFGGRNIRALHPILAGVQPSHNFEEKNQYEKWMQAKVSSLQVCNQKWRILDTNVFIGDHINNQMNTPLLCLLLEKCSVTDAM